MADLSALTATLQSLPGAAPSAAPAPSTSNKLSIVNPLQAALSVPQPAPVNDFARYNGGQTISRENPTNYTPPAPGFFKTSDQLDPEKINLKVPFTADKYISLNSPVSPGNSKGIFMSNAGTRVAEMAANLPGDFLQAIPRALETVTRESIPGLTGQTPKSEKLSTLEGMWYGSPEYRTTYDDIQQRIKNGDGTLSAYIGGLSQKTLDVAFGAQVLASGLSSTAKLLASSDDNAKIEAWRTLGSPKTEAEQKANYRSLTKQFHPDVTGGNDTAIKTINKANTILNDNGLPNVVTFAKQNAAQYTEWLGRQTELNDPTLFHANLQKNGPIESKPLPFKALPGTAPEPGQAAPMGLSTRRVTRVGGEHTTGDLFSSDGSGNFSKVAPKDSMPAVIKDGLDTFVVKKPEGFAVIEGKTGLQIGATAQTMAEAVSSAKQEIAANPNLDEHMNSKPLSPRYAEDMTPQPQQPGTGRKLAPYNESAPVAPVEKPSTLPGINPDQAEALTPEQVSPLADKAAARYYDQKIKPAIDSGKATVIGGDDLKDHFGKDYNDKNHPVYSKAAAQLYDRALTETKGDTVAFTGGGPGAGKTDILVNNIAKNLNGVLLDSNMSNPEVAARQIKAARDAGKKVLVYGILPDLGSSRVHTIIREMKGGHGISNKTFGRGHAGFPNTIKTLIENGTLKPEEVKILDTRYTFSLHDAIMKVATGDYIKDPLATINKLKYNEADIEKKYARENYSRKNQQGLPEQRVRDNADTTSRVDRTDKRSRLAGGDRPSVGGSAGGDQGQGGKAVSRKNGITLPKELSGAKPRYGYQDKQFELTFANDVDKALYIVAQKTPSKRDADYIRFLNNVFPNLSDEQIRSAGFDIRTQIKNLAKNADPGTIEVPSSQKISGASAKESSGGKAVSRGTKDIDQLIRMLDREKQSLAQAEAHPEAHAKAYGAGKADEYRKKIKQLVRRIEEDHTPRTLKEKTNKTPKVYPLEQHIGEMSTEMGFLEDVIAGNRARALSRYANKSGELPEALGGQKGLFANEGDSIVTQLGYPDSETARAAYSDYLLQKKRLFVVRNNLRVLKDTLREMKITDTDERSLTKLLNKNASLSEKQISDLAKKGKAPLTEKQIEERKQLAEDRQKRLIGQMAATEPAIGWQAPEQTLSALLQAQPLTLGEFEKMNNAFSLKQMVVDTSTSVNKKVNLIDHFLRTPDRVLEKIGLKPIADNLRHSYESYVAELPGHIEVISNWAKRVPESGANERIFDWLDGQTIRDKFKPGGSKPLAGEELVVAKEIKQYLHDWAERLGLPDDNRISHYITHVFAIGEVAKEFDEDVAKLIKDKQPGSVYDPFLEKRLGKKGYIRDTWASLDAYAKRAVRKANMDPVLDQMKTAAARLEESQATYLKKYANLINMRPTDIDNLTDNLLKSIFGYRFGQRPTALLTRTARQWIYRSMLGLNFSSAIKNLTQGVNTFAVLGARYTLRGYRELMMHPNSQELEDAGILKQDFIQDRTLSSTRKAIQKIDKGLFTLFDLAEKINRGSAYFGAKAKAMKLGASEYDAMQYAKKIVRDTQFQFGSIDTPVGLNSDMAKVLTQFMSFGFKQAEFAAENIKSKNYAGIVRYILGALFMTYVVGKVFNIKGRDFIPGYSFTKFGTPPTLALPLAIFKAVVDAPDAYGHTRSLSQKGQDIFSNIPFPASIQARNTYKLVTGSGSKNSSASASGGSFGTGKKLKPMKGASAATGRKLKPFGR